MEKAGHEVFIFTFGDLDYPDDETNVIRSPGLPLTDTGYYLNFRYSRRAKALLQTMDLVHVHHPFLSGRLALNYCRPLHIPIVFTNHTRYDLYAQAYLPLLPEEIQRNLSADLHAAILPGRGPGYLPLARDGRGVEETGGHQSDRNHPQRRGSPAVPNGLRRLPPGFWVQQDGYPADLFRVGWDRKKTWIFSSALLPGLAEAVPNAHLLIVGGGPEEESLKQAAARTGCCRADPFHRHASLR